jgi:hypothetical protein
MFLRRTNRTLILATVLVTLLFQHECVSSFVSKTLFPSRQAYSTDVALKSSRDSVDGDMSQLRERIQMLKVKMLDEDMNRPPNASLGPTQFVEKILEGLLNSYDPYPDSGFHRLLRASTKEWREKMYHSIGAPPDAPEEMVASALGSALSRPKQQFGILVGTDDAEDYYVCFPSDVVDNLDGTCWLETRLYDSTDHELLVITGWELQQRPSDGAWLVAGIDWQDFRDQYRPGLGREEWERICG